MRFKTGRSCFGDLRAVEGDGVVTGAGVAPPAFRQSLDLTFL